MRSFSVLGATCILPIIRWNGMTGVMDGLEKKYGTSLNSSPKKQEPKQITKNSTVTSTKGSMTYKFRRNMYGVIKGNVIEVEAESAEEALKRLARRTGWDTKYFKEVTE